MTVASNQSSLAYRPLSRREKECLFWAAHGKSSSDIAAIIGLSSRTVDSYVGKACSKLGVRTRVEAIAVGIRHGVIDLDASF